MLTKIQGYYKSGKYLIKYLCFLIVLNSFFTILLCNFCLAVDIGFDQGEKKKNTRFSLFPEAWYAYWWCPPNKMNGLNGVPSNLTTLIEYKIKPTIVTGFSGEMGTERFGIGVEYFTNRLAKQYLPEEANKEREGFFKDIDYFTGFITPRLSEHWYAVLISRAGIFNGNAWGYDFVREPNTTSGAFTRVNREIKTSWYKQDVLFMRPFKNRAFQGLGGGLTFMYYELPLTWQGYEQGNSVPLFSTVKNAKVFEYMFTIGTWTLPVKINQSETQLKRWIFNMNGMAGLGYAHIGMEGKKLDGICFHADAEAYIGYQYRWIVAKAGIMAVYEKFSAGGGGPRTATKEDEEKTGVKAGETIYDAGEVLANVDAWYGPVVSIGVVF